MMLQQSLVMQLFVVLIEWIYLSSRFLQLVEKGLYHNEEMGRRSARAVISLYMRLGVTLKMLDGASYLDIMSSFRIGSSIIYGIFNDSGNTLKSALKLPDLPKTYDEVRKIYSCF